LNTGNCRVVHKRKWLFVCVGLLAFSGGMVAASSVNVNASQIGSNNAVRVASASSKDAETSFSWGTSKCTVSGDTLTVGPGKLSAAIIPTGHGLTPQSPIEDHPEAYGISKVVVEKGVQFPDDSAYLFANLFGVKSIDFQDIDTSNVTNMANLFSNDGSLSEIDGLNNLDTQNVTTMANMFCSDPVTSLDLSGFNTAKVSDMSGMFTYASELKTLDVSKFDTQNVKNMDSMFNGTGSLTGLDVSNFDTSNVTDMGGMFMAMTSLESSQFKGYENLNTAKVTDMGDMFSNSSKLTKLDLSNYDTSQVTNMDSMFYMPTNSALQKLDLSGKFNTAKVTDFDGMLQGLHNLWELKLGPNTDLQSNVYLEDPTGTSTNPTTFSDIDMPNMAFQNTGQDWREVGNGSVHHPTGTQYRALDLINLYANANKPTTDKTYVWDQKGIDAGKVTVKYVDENGQQIHDPQIVPGFIGDTFNVNAPAYKLTINNYTLDQSKLPNKLVFGKDPQTVTFVYARNGGSGSTSYPGSTTTSSTPATPINPSTPIRPNAPAASKTPTKPGSTIAEPSYAAVKGAVVYSVKKIGLYQSTRFSAAKRLAWYPKQNRANRPMFRVTGYKRAANGALRYKVRDVNHGRKTAGKTGYITASPKYVVSVYYASVPKSKKVTVISPKGVTAYKTASLTGKVKHYKKGIRLTVKKLVRHHLATRYQLSNGHFITANKKLIIAGNH
jgi:surface protein